MVSIPSLNFKEVDLFGGQGRLTVANYVWKCTTALKKKLWVVSVDVNTIILPTGLRETELKLQFLNKELDYF